MHNILYHEKVFSHDIPKLDRSSARLIKKAIETKLTFSPEVFGKPLRQTLIGYRKLRVGDYRVIFKIAGDTVRILAIGHRSFVYEIANDRASD